MELTWAGSMAEMSRVGSSTAFRRCTMASVSPGLDVSALHNMCAWVPAAYLRSRMKLLGSAHHIHGLSAGMD